MPGSIGLTPTSYVVLGLVAQHGPVTSYTLKQTVAIGIGNFWPFPHSQLYAEPARLAGAGLLNEDIEPRGRKRRRYTITSAGREALDRWLEEPSAEPTQVRDLALLKLYFGGLGDAAGRRALAAEQQQAHLRRRLEYVGLDERYGHLVDEHGRRTLLLALEFETMMANFWASLASPKPDDEG